MSYYKDRIKAFGFAFSGLRQSFRQETHLKLHAVITLLTIGSGFFFELSATEWLFLLLAIVLVICLEMINSALEKLCDLVMPEQNAKIKYIKDVAAGAVLIACAFAVIVGVVVFYPHLK